MPEVGLVNFYFESLTKVSLSCLVSTLHWECRSEEILEAKTRSEVNLITEFLINFFL